MQKRINDYFVKMSWKSYLQKDWTFLPILIFLLAGYAWSVYEFTVLDEPRFPPLYLFFGLILFTGGVAIELKVRTELTDKAKFPDFSSTKKLQIVEGHQLITDGIFKYVRHPLYIGRTLLSFGWTFIFSSLFGLVLITFGVIFFIPRIRIEENMLSKEFGDAYVLSSINPSTIVMIQIIPSLFFTPVPVC